MTIKIKAFGPIADKMNARELELNHPGNLDDLRKALHEKYPQLVQLDFAIAVDRKIIRENAPLRPGAEVALLPPFSGG